MLNTLKIKNFRGFEDHELSFRKMTIVVGRNNAGKSSIVEALRILALVVGRYKNLPFRNPPDWSELPRRYSGVSPSLRQQGINFSSMFYQYRSPPAEIEAAFSGGERIVIFIGGEDQVHAVIYDSSGEIIPSGTVARKLALPVVSIMPQPGPVSENEVVLTEDYVHGAISSRLAPQHFRNQIKLFPELFRPFREAVEATWPGVQVRELVGRRQSYGSPLSLQVRDEEFVADVADMGHGLQMWLQAIWFLVRSKEASTIILDEPDVYMHADLQRRLIRFLRDKYPQVIVATHSLEIISEVEPDDILIVDRRRRRSNFASSLPAVQRVLTTIGSAHNLHLARLWNAQRILLVEGKDVAILKRLQNAIFPNSKIPLDTIPNMAIGGWSGWNYAVGTSMVLRNSVGEEVTTYCVFDSDYHTGSAITTRKKEAKDRNVELHIWCKKEIENYLLVPEAIQRLIASEIRHGVIPTIDEVRAKLDQISASLEQEVFDAMATQFLTEDRSLGVGGANKKAREELKLRLNKSNGLINTVSGKTVLGKISEWSQTSFGVSFGSVALASTIRRNEIDSEIQDVISTIERKGTF